jgi:hypothetical protein
VGELLALYRGGGLHRDAGKYTPTLSGKEKHPEEAAVIDLASTY